MRRSPSVDPIRPRKETEVREWQGCDVRWYCRHRTTVGLDVRTIREYIRNQEDQDKHEERLPLEGIPPS